MVKVGIVVDGEAESQALKLLTRRIAIDGVQLLDPRFADMQPKSTAKQIAKSASTQVSILKKQKADVVVVLIDREDRRECCGDWAVELEGAFDSVGFQGVKVVVKNRKLENWLIADVAVFRKLKSRYKVTSSFEKSVKPNRADSVEDAELLLNKVVVSGEYHKRRDAGQILGLQDCLEVGQHSRSFRRFLRLIKHPVYESQSRKPAQLGS